MERLLLTDEEVSAEKEETKEETKPSEETQATAAPDNNEKFREKFRLTTDEEILRHMKPSPLAFAPMYLLAGAILFAHWMFEMDWETENSTISTIMQALITFGKVGNFGFVLIMLGVAWVNRMINGPTSGKWTTSFLLLVAFTPAILSIDNILASLGVIENDFIPIDSFSYLTFGFVWTAIFLGMTILYQRSFHYAITNHRIIFTQHLIIPGDARRILFDNINEIRTQRTLLGSIFGFKTIICDTGSQLGIGEDSMSVSVGTTGSENPVSEATGMMKWMKRMFAFVTYQRTRKVDMPDPRYSLYCINQWQATERLLNEMHQKHSQSGILSELKEKLE